MGLVHQTISYLQPLGGALAIHFVRA